MSFQVVLFASTVAGAFEVTGEAEASVTRVDGQAIDTNLAFEALENSTSLGRERETDFALRQRILLDTRRQDVIRELEIALNALPNIFTCNLVFNPSDVDVVTLDDGTVLAPKELLIVITGAPDAVFAQTVVARTYYRTHMSNAADVIWYYNDILAGGKYPVYFTTHKRRNFYLTINYRYNRGLVRQDTVEKLINRLLNKYKNTVVYTAEITEPILYADLAEHGIAGLEIRKIYIQDQIEGSLQSVASIEVPRLMLPNLVSITYIVEEVQE
jgi:hypothetical protein